MPLVELNDDELAAVRELGAKRAAERRAKLVTEPASLTHQERQAAYAEECIRAAGVKPTLSALAAAGVRATYALTAPKTPDGWALNKVFGVLNARLSSAVDHGPQPEMSRQDRASLTEDAREIDTLLAAQNVGPLLTAAVEAQRKAVAAYRATYADNSFEHLVFRPFWAAYQESTTAEMTNRSTK